MDDTENLTVRITRRLCAPPNDVFEAWLDPDGMRQWMCPGDTRFFSAELEPRVGGRFRIVMGSEPDGVEHTGEYRELRRYERLVFTWNSKNTFGRETLVTIDLRPVGGETELTLTHQGLLNEEWRGRHEGGWSSIVDKLAAQLARWQETKRRLHYGSQCCVERPMAGCPQRAAGKGKGLQPLTRRSKQIAP